MYFAILFFKFTKILKLNTVIRTNKCDDMRHIQICMDWTN